MQNYCEFRAQSRIDALPFADTPRDLTESATQGADFGQAALEPCQFIERHRRIRSHVCPDQSRSISGVFHATPLRPQSKPLPISGTQPKRNAIPIRRLVVAIITGFVNRVALQYRIDEQPQELGFRQATTRRQCGELTFPVGRGPGGDLLPDSGSRIHAVYPYLCVIFV